jgi:hypothetical protein
METAFSGSGIFSQVSSVNSALHTLTKRLVLAYCQQRVEMNIGLDCHLKQMPCTQLGTDPKQKHHLEAPDISTDHCMQL